jgi:hypothetical protein
VPTKFDSIAEAAISLGNRSFILPLDELELAIAFANLPDIEIVVGRLIRELFDNSNMHVRRIAVNACRRSKAFASAGLEDALTRRLGDPEPWVRYDAAWAIQDAVYDSDEIRRMLAAAAVGWSPADDESVRARPGDAEAQARVKARKALDALLEKPH